MCGGTGPTLHVCSRAAQRSRRDREPREGTRGATDILGFLKQNLKSREKRRGGQSDTRSEDRAWLTNPSVLRTI